MAFEITITKQENGIIAVVPIGSIDIDTYEEFDAQTVKALALHPRGIIFDMEGVSYITSLGMSVIYKTKKAIEDQNGIIAVVNPQPQIKKVLDIVKFFPSKIFATMQEAQEHLNAFSVQQ